MVFYIGANIGVRFRDTTKFRLPVAVRDHPVDVTGFRACFPAVGLRCVETNVDGRAGGVVWIEQRLDRTLTEKFAGDRGGDFVTCHVGQRLIHQQRGISLALANKTGIEPLFGNALQLAEKVELGFLAGVAPFRVEQPLRHLKDEGGGTHVAEVLEAHVHAFADDAGVARNGRADQIGIEFQDGFFVKIGAETLLRQLDAIAFDAREANFERVAFWLHSLDLNRLTRRLRRRDDRLSGEVEGNAEDIGVFDI